MSYLTTTELTEFFLRVQSSVDAEQIFDTKIRELENNKLHNNSNVQAKQNERN